MFGTQTYTHRFIKGMHFRFELLVLVLHKQILPNHQTVLHSRHGIHDVSLTTPLRIVKRGVGSLANKAHGMLGNGRMRVDHAFVWCFAMPISEPSICVSLTEEHLGYVWRAHTSSPTKTNL